MFQPLPRFSHRAKPQACLVVAPRVATASVLVLVSVFGLPGCSYQLDSVRSKTGNEVEWMVAIASEPAGLVPEGDLVVARAAVSELLGKRRQDHERAMGEPTYRGAWHDHATCFRQYSGWPDLP